MSPSLNIVGLRTSNSDSCDGVVDLIASVKQITEKVMISYNSFKIHDALSFIMQLFRSVNKYLEVKAPWKLVKDPNNISQVGTILYLSAEILRIGTLLIYPVIPEKSKEVFSYLGINLDFDLTFGQLKSNTEISKPKNLFPRIDTD